MPQIARQHLISWANEVIADSSSDRVHSDHPSDVDDTEAKGSVDAMTVPRTGGRDACLPEAALTPDIMVISQGTVVCLTAQNDAARVWLEENLEADSALLGRTHCIEHRHLEAIVRYAIADGLIVIAG